MNKIKKVAMGLLLLAVFLLAESGTYHLLGGK
jgi:hypothetical protein